MIRYRVRFPRPETHHVSVTLTIDAAPAGLRLWMPTWTPGSYLIREFAKNLRDVTAKDATGRALAVTRSDKASFAVASKAGEAVVVEYRVYAFERSVRTDFVDAHGGLLNGAPTFLTVAGREHDEHVVEVELPAGWSVATALEPIAGGGFRAQDHARLVDAPILVGELRRFPFDVDGVPHALVFLGEGNFDGASLAEQSRRIVAVNARAFGGLPYRRYEFLTVVAPDGRGGLEHADSCVLQHPRFEFREENALVDFWTLVAHEHLHAWNVKRFRPADFHPYDLANETYTRLLWLVEGVTAYQDELIPLRAGLVPADRYLKRLADEITRYAETPARRAETIEDASLLAWVRHYRQDEDTPNSGVNYYQLGALAALVLDVEMRVASDGKRGIDDLLRALDRKFGDGKSGYTAADVESIASEIAGRDLAATFRRLYRTTEEIDFASVLAEVGIVVTRGPRKTGPTARDLLGVRIDANAQRAVIDVVERDSPGDRAGLSPRDEIVALDGNRVRVGDLARRLAERCGSTCTLMLFRDDRLVTATASIPAPPAHCATLAEDPKASPRARMLREAWLAGSPFSREKDPR